MTSHRNQFAIAILSFSLLAPVAALAQTTHQEAEAAQTRSDHRHHTGAKIVGGSAAGGAVIGAVAGGPERRTRRRSRRGWRRCHREPRS